MKLISIQEAFIRKINRQKELAEIFKKAEFHCGGYCFHKGKISNGCVGCFLDDEKIFTLGERMGEDVGLPNVCNFACPHCFPSVKGNYVAGAYAVPLHWKLPEAIKQNYLETMERGHDKFEYLIYNFTGTESEPLFYLPVIEQLMKFAIDEVEPIAKKRGFAKVYTNGVFLNDARIKQLADMRIDEVRVNVTADGFSKKVYDNIARAVDKIPVVTVEVPIWEPYRNGLFEMLPILDDLGVKHFDLCQIEIQSEKVFKKIAAKLPADTEYYQVGDRMLNLDDQGLCEELMREVLEKKYAYSVIDCNAFVKMVYKYSSYANGKTFDKEAFADEVRKQP